LQLVSHPDEAPALRQARPLQQLLGLRLRDRRLHPKNRSYPGATSVGGGVGGPI
jgi:hypothetical protein